MQQSSPVLTSSQSSLLCSGRKVFFSSSWYDVDVQQLVANTGNVGDNRGEFPAVDICRSIRNDRSATDAIVDFRGRGGGSCAAVPPSLCISAGGLTGGPESGVRQYGCSAGIQQPSCLVGEHWRFGYASTIVFLWFCTGQGKGGCLSARRILPRSAGGRLWGRLGGGVCAYGLVVSAELWAWRIHVSVVRGVSVSGVTALA